MKITAIIAEYNLLHRGHLKQINFIKRNSGDDTVIVALMSGNYVQRGEPAIADKFTRAAAAVDSGVDIVLELPYPWNCGAAEYFATAALVILNSFKNKIAFDDLDFFLCFGSKSGNIKDLVTVSERLDSFEYKRELEKERHNAKSNNLSDIVLREKVYASIYGDSFPVDGNDILGIEYLRAIRNLKSGIIPYTLKRVGNESATISRKYYLEGNYEKLIELCPESITSRLKENKPVTLERAQQSLLAYMRLADRKKTPESDGMTFGLWNRFCRMAAESNSTDEFFNLCSTKKYTDARLRRTLIHAFFSTSKKDLSEFPMYTTVLAASAEGRKVLSLTRKSQTDDFSIYTKQAHVFKDSSAVSKQFEKNFRADSFYSLIEGRPSDFYIKHRPYMK